MFHNFSRYRIPTLALGIGVVITACLMDGCKNDQMKNDLVGVSPLSKQVAVSSAETVSPGMQVSLVGDNTAYTPQRIDPNLRNPWGIAINPNNGIVWIAVNHTSNSVVYDQNGNQLRGPVAIPLTDSTVGGSPTGIVFNPTGQFVIPSTGEASKFIFASEDGIISAWGSGSTAKVVVDHSGSGAVYKGLALASRDGRSFIYAANFKGNQVEVFDDHFQMVMKASFHDSALPDGFAPFNIQNIDGLLYVSYAKQKGPDNTDDLSGAGNGYVDVYATGGELLQRFASQGTLNSPWGLAGVREGSFGMRDGGILVGNFGDGRINLFNKHGKFLRQLADSSGLPVTIEGLWALTFGGISGMRKSHGNGGMDDHGSHHDDDRKGQDTLRLFFTAGPNGEEDGLFGYIKEQPVAADSSNHHGHRDHDGKKQNDPQRGN